MIGESGSNNYWRKQKTGKNTWDLGQALYIVGKPSLVLAPAPEPFTWLSHSPEAASAVTWLDRIDKYDAYVL